MVRRVILLVLLMFLTLSFISVAHAQAQQAQEELTPEQLARAEACHAFCAKNYPKSLQGYAACMVGCTLGPAKSAKSAQ